MFLEIRHSLGIPDGWCPVKKKITQQFASIDKVRDIQSKTWLLHGEEDESCPLSHGQALFEALGSQEKEMKTYSSTGHNDIWGDSRFLSDLDAFLVHLDPESR